MPVKSYYRYKVGVFVLGTEIKPVFDNDIRGFKAGVTRVRTGQARGKNSRPQLSLGPGPPKTRRAWGQVRRSDLTSPTALATQN